MKRLLMGVCLATLLSTPVLAETPANTLVIAKAIDDMVTMDPAEIYELSNSEVAVNVYDRLMGLEIGDMKTLVPKAAESWSVSEDGKTFTFKLKPNLKFHSGNPLTADDVAFSLQRVILLNLTPAYLLQGLGWTPENVKEMAKAVDPATVQLTINEKYAPTYILNLMSTVTSSIVDKKEALAHEKNGDLGHDWLKTNSAGSGAYRMRSWKANDSVVLEANPDFRLGAPKLQRVIVRHVPEGATQRLLVEKGDIDIARNLTPDQIKGIAGNTDLVVETFPKATVYYLGLNQKNDKLKNPKVQEALRWLIDYQGMADSFLKGQMLVHQAFWPAGFYASLENNPYKLDTAKAKALLAEAGYPNGFDIQLDTGNTQPFTGIAQSIQSTFAEAGVKVTINSAEVKQALTKYRARQHEMIYMYWGPDYLDPNANADSFANNPDNSDSSASKPLAWRNAWDIPEIMAETKAALKESDAEKRKQQYLDLQTKLQTTGPFLNMFQESEQTVMRKNVKGFFSGPNSDLVFYYQTTK
ncbi:ABC transporter substrate-binding protein [Aestuariivirga sp. YIM B02566]|uniref:ABC transporter substrate-binding protein n=1 Tax=Taklimakanibacter albus TaxID=2800327 RepID=A0ACC5QZD0_9HYPH|nr:ABC transporter substrate-binding protein [Aestuariivirga sp. YIM B02566]MBK1865717.1 ABC transporter substrate-binding protein [Aestuariivirga sp. YIM B02566]